MAEIISLADWRQKRVSAVATPLPSTVLRVVHRGHPAALTPLAILDRIAANLGLPPLEDDEPTKPKRRGKP